MSGPVLQLLANFTSPESIGVGPRSMLWLLPLAGAIAVVYKATKVRKIRALSFARECIVLFASIVVFMVIAAVILLAMAWLITE